MPPEPSAERANFEAARARFDAEAARTVGVDRFCSSLDWGLPAHAAFLPEGRPRLFVGAHGCAAFLEHVSEGGGRLLLPLETVWGLGTPIVGGADDARALAAEALAFARALPGWTALVVTGLPPEAPLFAAIAAEASRRRLSVGLGAEPLRRCLIDLEAEADATSGDGAASVERYLARRSRNLRRSLLRADERACDDGLLFETFLGPLLGPPEEARARGAALFERLLAVERRSWKAGEGSGLAAPEMQAFYRAMVPRLAEGGRLVLTFARDGGRGDGRDVGYILGALFAGVYRGLQFSYDDAYAARGLGNVLQLRTLRWAAARGVRLYDLGAEVEYKHRFSDRIVEARTLVLRR